ncbi:unnamed protein product [Paramecium sonneborni]|uniref:Uncharacterized protein n=1 Tax=Paramecium sonneborni TaxID=65129 RepID=A0A8S1NAX3_9CILI|nr:unnamed protein product [Paramecium sonneborni]
MLIFLSSADIAFHFQSQYFQYIVKSQSNVEIILHRYKFGLFHIQSKNIHKLTNLIGKHSILLILKIENLGSVYFIFSNNQILILFAVNNYCLTYII